MSSSLLSTPRVSFSESKPSSNTAQRLQHQHDDNQESVFLPQYQQVPPQSQQQPQLQLQQQQQQHQRRSSDAYDVTSTMHRLRSSLMGDMSEGTKWTYGTINAPGLLALTPESSNIVDQNDCATTDSHLNYGACEGQNKMNQNQSFANIDDSNTRDELTQLRLACTENDNENGCQKKSLINDKINWKSHLLRSRKKCHQHFSHHNRFCHALKRCLYQVPAISLIGMFHLMVGIPFGVSYFPVSWRAKTTVLNVTTLTEGNQIYKVESNITSLVNHSDTTLEVNNTGAGSGESVDKIDNEFEGKLGGIFPVPGKESLGIRMFLFATIIGQLSFTTFSGFDNPIGLQMVENVPFCHELSHIAIQHQGYTMDALSTIFVMFGLSSIIVGIVFYVLGKFKLGRVVYYFPKHVLVGCIGGIGIFIAKTGIEVAMNDVFHLATVISKYDLLIGVAVFEIVLRILEQTTRNPETGNARYPLLAPIYFCSITPMFYLALYALNISVSDARHAGYFFPQLDSGNDNNNVFGECDGVEQANMSITCTSTSSPSSYIWGLSSTIFNEHLFDMWRVIDLSTVSIPAIIDAIPTMVALILFSLIHVPINIPAFAISSNSDVDMNMELISHGYSNIASGIFGGLQNYMAYTQSVLYHKSGGKGKTSGYAVAFVTSFLFFVGPTIASYIPRCMAGCLLLHVGTDLFLEGVYDSFGKFDYLEYVGIWLITTVMTVYGMEASMIAGFVAAISTYAVQNTAYVNPIRGFMSATTLRSSHFQRSAKANEILSDPHHGRSRILVIQLQGHLFFGNMALLSDSICDIIVEKCKKDVIGPSIVILDFGLVLGIDTSAAHAIQKLRNTIHRKYNITLCIFVSGSSDGFPTFYNLSKELSSDFASYQSSIQSNHNPSTAEGNDDGDSNSNVTYISNSNQMTGFLNPPKVPMPVSYTGSQVFTSLDEALVFAENALLAQHDATLLGVEAGSGLDGAAYEKSLSLTQEHDIALENLIRLAPKNTDVAVLEKLLSVFVRETYVKGDVLWKQGSTSTCAKLLLRGQLMAMLEDEAGTCEMIAYGNLLGELGLVDGVPRMSSVIVVSDEAVLYSISIEAYHQLLHYHPLCANVIDKICIKYLSARVQHVSNRVYETRCLPV